jgi:Histidine kinase
MKSSLTPFTPSLPRLVAKVFGKLGRSGSVAIMKTPLDSIPLRRIASGPLRGLSTHQFIIALGLGAVVAITNLAIVDFKMPSIVWLRCLMCALVALCAFVWAGNLETTRLPRPLARLGAMLAAAMLVMLALYAIQIAFAWSQGSLSEECCGVQTYVRGWLQLSVTALLVGSGAALIYMLSESSHEAKQQSLRFDLERKTLEAQALAAQMRAMQAQVEPHFLFNTLANVQQLVELQSPRAAPLLGNLIGYLRAAVPQMRTDMTTLEREFEMARNYLAIMQMRMPDRLRWRVELPEALKAAPIPPLAVMTLVENAVSHGIDPTENGGEVTVLAQADGGSISIVVSDTGAGFAEAAAEGFGLKHLRERLAMLWGTRASLQLTQNAAHGTIAALTLPNT